MHRWIGVPCIPRRTGPLSPARWWRGVAAAMFGVAALGIASANATNLPADIVVYGEQRSSFRDGNAATNPFPSSGGIFEYHHDADDPVTRLKFRDIPGLANELGQFPHGIATFGKYVLLGNGATLSVGGTASVRSIGIFDTETKMYCNLDIPTANPVGTPYLAVANPNSRQSRILFGSGTPDPVFGYILADLDGDACTWPIVTADVTEFNGSVPPICPTPPNSGPICAFDGFVLLAHQEDNPDDEFGTDFVAVSDYWRNRTAVVQVDVSAIRAIATYDIPPFTPPNGGGICYTSAQAHRPVSDFVPIETDTRNGDWRFLYSYDAFPVQVFDTPPPAACAGTVHGFCPQDWYPSEASHQAKGNACPNGGAGPCVHKYCKQNPKMDCTSNPNACIVDLGPLGTFDLGPCQDTCVQKSDAFVCTTTNKQCLTDPNEPGYFCYPNETCDVAIKKVEAPSQELRYVRATNTLGPSSPKFYSGTGNGGNPLGTASTGAVYDSARSLWVNGVNQLLVYRVNANGEHDFFDDTPGDTAVVVAPDDMVPYEVLSTNPYLPTTTQIGNRMYIADAGSLQLAQDTIFGWLPVSPSTFKVGFAYLPGYLGSGDPLAPTSLPLDPRRCQSSKLACNTTADCSDCQLLGENGIVAPVLLSNGKYIEAGGAPTSIWTQSGYNQRVNPLEGDPPLAQTAKFLLRVPVTNTLPDNASTIRPSIAWDGERLWLVAEHNGQLKYRIRNGGQWSGWYSLAPNNLTPVVAGVAVIADTTSVRIYARDSSGRVLEKKLSTALNCQPDDAIGVGCDWGNWTQLPAIPGGLTTSTDIAATYAGSNPLVAVRASDNTIQAILGTPGFGTASWTRIGALMATDLAPTVTYHVPGGQVWIAAKLAGSQILKYSRINPTTPLTWTSWDNVQLTGAPSAFAAAPGIVSDGTTVRVIVPDSAQTVWQVANDGSGWSGWRKSPAGGLAGRQPVAANVFGEIDLVTMWAGTIQQASIP
jgi:hypothetical protein